MIRVVLLIYIFWESFTNPRSFTEGVSPMVSHVFMVDTPFAPHSNVRAIKVYGALVVL